ncbi:MULTISPECIES: FISUMP domain-containing protein [unclassified Fibrobacter]|uniref:FISUMP domain-containing protein n=1 Tax=unclassified Fibrobacter TaxID=2634177 RepID=UPI0025B8F219|nr:MULTISPECIES: FISUMP domain-containing protein [unclassified Fibrobacter]
MLDERDGQVYRTVIVGNRVWMAENLNFAGNDDYPLVLERSACLNFDDDNCALLGRLYSREAAMDNVSCMFGVSCDIGDTLVRGVCPKGWHIPSNAEALALVNAFGDELGDVRSAKGWSSYKEGVNTSGFSMPASGCLDFGDDRFESPGKTGYVWAYLKGSNMRYLIFRGPSDNDVIIHSGYSSNIFVSVRCVSDDTLKVALSSSSRVSSSSVSSSSSVKSSSSSVVSSASKDNFFNSDVTYGSLKDSRDGQVYKTVEINGTTWMAENLNFAGNSDWPLPKNYSYCYGGIAANCALYGRLYDRAAAMNSTTCGYGKSCSLYDGLNRGVCPDGWHIPSEEVDDLMDFTLGNRKTLRSVDGWVDREVGANESGFSLVGSGVRADKNYVNQGRFAALWYYSTGVVQNYLVFSGVEDKMYLTENSKETVYISVRCVKGAGAEPASSGSTKSSSSGSSSSVESSSSEESSSSFDKTVLFNSAVSYGEMTDSRDGQTYRTLNIAGRTWMAENLNFADSSKLPILEGNNRCYDDDPSECEAFGRLYSREAALNDSRCTCYNGTCPSMSGNVQGICPSGWHIPSKSEAEQLANLNGNQASSLNSSYGWATDRRGNNSTGMSFVGAGVYQRQTGSVGFKGKGNYTNLWVYDVSTPNENWYLMDVGKSASGNGTIAVMDDAGYDPFYTVRCVKN